MDKLMDRFFTRMLVVCLLSSAVNFAFSQNEVAPTAADIVISSGLEGGGYWNAGGRLQVVANDMGLTVENHSTMGSLANLKELLDRNSPVNLAFAQADALQYYLNENPDAAQAIETLENIGEECVFIISDSSGGIRTDKDIQEAPVMHLGIKTPNSGIWVTFDYMKSLIPELRHTTVRYGNAVDMMNEFAHPKTDIKRAVMVVHGPNERSPEIDMVIANPDRFRFVKVSDERLTQKTSSGESIYRRMRIAPGAVEGAGRVETICVMGLLLANKNKLTGEQHNKLMELINNNWSQVHSTTE
jgi:TRAP-type uncharacterized transport system substrate-binding protein